VHITLKFMDCYSACVVKLIVQNDASKLTLLVFKHDTDSMQIVIKLAAKKAYVD